MVWASEGTGTAQPSIEASSSVVPPPSSSPSMGPEPTCQHASCGNPEWEGHSDCLVDSCEPVDSQYAVRCCSDEALHGYEQRNGCSVWAESQLLSVGDGDEGCVHDATYEEAVMTCTGDGARLCTMEEMQGMCTAGTGCGHDSDMVWVSEGTGTAQPSIEPSSSVVPPPSSSPSTPPSSSASVQPSTSPTMESALSPTMEPALSPSMGPEPTCQHA